MSCDNNATEQSGDNMNTFITYEKRLHRMYDKNEARSILRLFIEKRYGLSLTDICLGELKNLSKTQSEELQEAVSRLEKGEPVQYVLGVADFLGREFAVRSGVLIPRPETEELVNIVVERLNTIQNTGKKPKSVLDIGCGSGCISISIALESDAHVTAWDISDTALNTTRENARLLGADIEVVRQDALDAPADDTALWDIIVSNPPYICTREAEEMERNVLDYEPHTALFVPDTDPLLFYRAIALYASHALKPGGTLCFEINAAYGEEMTEMMQSVGCFENIEVLKDAFGRERFLVAGGFACGTN